jgi:hypothetical protein
MSLTGIVVVVLRLFNVASTLPAVVTVNVKKLVPCWTRVPPKNSEPAGVVSTEGGVGAGWVVLVSSQPTARHNTTRTAKKRATLIRRGSILVGRT